MNNINIDWATKKAQGRVKDIGVPWTEEELAALQSGATPEELRGETKPTVAKNVNSTGPATEKALDKMSKTELSEKAASLGLELVYESTSAKQFIALITEAIEAKSKKSATDENQNTGNEPQA